MIPKTVKVAGIKYEKKEIPGMEVQFNRLGQILYTRGTIKLEIELSEDRKEQVFIHELLHAIFYEAGIGDQDEDMVNRLGIVLYQVLKDNRVCFNMNEAPTL